MNKSFRNIDEALRFEERMKEKGFITAKGLEIEKFRPVVTIWFCEKDEFEASRVKEA